MAAVAEPTPVTRRSPDWSDPRIVLECLSWSTFRRILDETGNRRRSRFAYAKGSLEILSPGMLREQDRIGLDHLIGVVCEEAEIAYHGYGSTTWYRDNVERAIEADKCYYFAAEKLAAAGNAARRRSNDSTEYPIPDLAIDIDMRQSALDRGAIYAAFGVSEVWSYERSAFHVLGLGDDGRYRESAMSRFLPIRPDDIDRWIQERDSRPDDRAWIRDLRAWVRTELAGRV